MNPTNLFLLAQTIDPAGQAAAQPLLAGWLVFLLVVVLFAVPFALGRLIAGALKLKDLGLKIGVILFAVELGLAPFVSQYLVGWLEQRRYRQELARFEQKQEQYDITPDGLNELKKQIPDLEVVPRQGSAN